MYLGDLSSIEERFPGFSNFQLHSAVGTLCSTSDCYLAITSLSPVEIAINGSEFHDNSSGKSLLKRLLDESWYIKQGTHEFSDLSNFNSEGALRGILIQNCLVLCKECCCSCC